MRDTEKALLLLGGLAVGGAVIYAMRSKEQPSFSIPFADYLINLQSAVIGKLSQQLEASQVQQALTTQKFAELLEKQKLAEVTNLQTLGQSMAKAISELKLPTISVQMPSITMPSVSVQMPSITLPKFEFPEVPKPELPKVPELPKLPELPKPELPKVPELPKLPEIPIIVDIIENVERIHHEGFNYVRDAITTAYQPVYQGIIESALIPENLKEELRKRGWSFLGGQYVG